ncbi:MAG: SUMF1/EgtB/PvdO family nonheme iron enzyme [Gammaproteobacteria bacterium]
MFRSRIGINSLGRGAEGGSMRVNRGGGWNNNARNQRSANRNDNSPENRNNNLGFRLASTEETRESVSSRCCGRCVLLFRRPGLYNAAENRALSKRAHRASLVTVA